MIRPLDPARRTALAAVSCMSARFCLAVGATGAQDTLAERWTGVRWSARAHPRREPHRVHRCWTAVSCAGSRACLAVGSYNAGVARDRRAVDRPPLAAGPAARRGHRRAAQRVLHGGRLPGGACPGPARPRSLRLPA